MSGIAYFVGIAAAALVIIVSFELLRRGRLRERHAIWWLAAGGVSLVVSVFPQVLGWIAQKLGVEVPLNLVLFGAVIVLFLVSLQHSSELTRVESKARILAEKIALLELDIEQAKNPNVENPS